MSSTFPSLLLSFIGHQLPHWWHWGRGGGERWGGRGCDDGDGGDGGGDVHAGEDRDLYWGDYGGDLSA